MLFSYPLMIVIQEICARIGRVTGVGIAGNMRRHYPRPLLFAIVSMLCLANVFNLGADLGAMGAAGQLLLGGPILPYIVGFAALSLILQIYIRYTTYVKYLKWLTLALFAYVLTAFVAHVDWTAAVRSMFLPSISFNAKYFTTLTAVLGTTISPYLFFWQASEEAEDVRNNGEQRRAEARAARGRRSTIRANTRGHLRRDGPVEHRRTLYDFDYGGDAARGRHSRRRNVGASGESARTARRPLCVCALRGRNHRHRPASQFRNARWLSRLWSRRNVPLACKPRCRASKQGETILRSVGSRHR